MDILEIMKARHSVRQYKNQAIESSKREEINALIKSVNAESKLSIQAFYDEPKCFDSFMAHYGKFENVKNYIAIVGNKNDQEKAGYYGEKTGCVPSFTNFKECRNIENETGSNKKLLLF